MGWFSKTTSNSNNEQHSSLKWIELKSIEQAKGYIEKSELPLVFFKHSTQCSISAMALNRLEREWKMDETKVIPVYLNLLAHRDVSNFLADYLQVQHQSPQILVVANGTCVFSTSHNAISASAIESVIQTLS